MEISLQCISHHVLYIRSTQQCAYCNNERWLSKLKDIAMVFKNSVWVKKNIMYFLRSKSHVFYEAACPFRMLVAQFFINIEKFLLAKLKRI